jgi:hypothetical protein
MKASRPLAIGLALGVLITGCGHKNGSSAPAPGEAQSAATGDIPDNQVFLTFHNASAGYSIKYPEGWARTGGGRDVTFRDKDNVVHIVVAKGRPQASARPGRKVTYRKLGTANPVTGKRVQLMVDRYVFARAGNVATLDLSTPRGVDNVDAYRLISRSFRWQ